MTEGSVNIREICCAKQCRETHRQRSALPVKTPDRARMHMAMIGNLTHDAVDNEFVGAIFYARNKRQCLNHERAFFIGGSLAMLTQNRHRCVTRIAIEDREFEWMSERRVFLRVFTQFAQFAFAHDVACAASDLMLECAALIPNLSRAQRYCARDSPNFVADFSQ